MNDINFVNVGLAGGQGVGFNFFFSLRAAFYIFYWETNLGVNGGGAGFVMYILFCVSSVCINDGRVVAMRDRNDGLYIMFMLFLGWPVESILRRGN